MKPKVLIIEGDEGRCQRLSRLLGSLAELCVVHRIAEENGVYRYYRRTGSDDPAEARIALFPHRFNAIVLNYDLENETADRTISSFELIVSWQSDEFVEAIVFLMVSSDVQLTRCLELMALYQFQDGKEVMPITDDRTGMVELVSKVRSLSPP